jgi:hypothetical protein
LVKRFRQAGESVKEADEYFEKMTTTIEKGMVDEWEAEMVTAEGERLHTPAAMDIMGTRLAAAVSNPSDRSGENSSSAEEEWISLALAVEEKQCVLFLFIRRPAATKSGT